MKDLMEEAMRSIAAAKNISESNPKYADCTKFLVAAAAHLNNVTALAARVAKSEE